MAATYCLHSPSMASSIPRASPSSSSSSSSLSPSSSLKRRTFKTLCSAKIPMPAIGPNDPFIARLALAAERSPERILNRPVNSDSPPFLDLFRPPQKMATSGEVNSDSSSFLDVLGPLQNMATPGQVERSVSYKPKTRRPPPDLPSLLLDNRVVYIGMPLVPAVTELVVAQFFYLQYTYSDDPVYVYINSSGTARDDGEVVGLESEGFAIYDVMMWLKNELRTVCLGQATNQTALLLAAGTKGRRVMYPSAKVLLQQPRLPSTGLLPTTDIVLRTKEAVHNKNYLTELLAKHTGNPFEVVANVMKRPYYMDCIKAKQFGIIDKILYRENEDLLEFIAPPEMWKNPSEVKTIENSCK